MTTLTANPTRTMIRARRARVADEAIVSAYIHEITPRQTVTAQTEDPVPERVLRVATAVDMNGHAARFPPAAARFSGGRARLSGRPPKSRPPHGCA